MRTQNRNLHLGKSMAGLSVAGLLSFYVLISPWEGRELKPYLDVGGVPTACSGITGAIITKAYNEGKVFTNSECDALDLAALKKHDKRVHDAITYKDVPTLSMAAFISFDFNTGRINNSTLTNLANKGDIKGACNQLSRWVRVKGQIVRGLQNRRFIGDGVRISERSLCMMGINPNYKDPLWERWYFDYQDWRQTI